MGIEEDNEKNKISAPTQDSHGPDVDKSSSKVELNLLSLGAVLLIIILSILVGSLWAINSSDSSSTKVSSITSPENTKSKEIEIWNATIRSPVADVLEILSLKDLAELEPGSPDSEKSYIFYRMCRDIQGFYKNLERIADAPDEQVDYLFKDWSSSVKDLADYCKTVDGETINIEEVDKRVARTWMLFDSFFIVISPYLEGLPAAPERSP
jgi:hypothetical protein